MVMRRDLDLAAQQLLHRMISAVVAEFQLEGFPSERNAGKLMSQADSEDRLASQQAPNIVDRIRAGLGIARTIGQEHAVWFQSQHILRRGLRRDYRHLAAFSARSE